MFLRRLILAWTWRLLRRSGIDAECGGGCRILWHGSSVSYGISVGAGETPYVHSGSRLEGRCILPAPQALNRSCLNGGIKAALISEMGYVGSHWDVQGHSACP